MDESTNDLVFRMGEFEAHFPTDRRYASNHMWALSTDRGTTRFGLTSYAVRLLQDVYFLDWEVDAPAMLKSKQQIGSIESKKAESDLYSPCAGTLVVINDEALDDPSVINVEPYSGGWLFEVETDEAFMTPEDYMEHLESAWKVAERTIKGQIR